MSNKIEEMEQKIEELKEEVKTQNSLICDYRELDVEREEIADKAFRSGYLCGWNDCHVDDLSRDIQGCTKAWLNYKIEARL